MSATLYQVSTRNGHRGPGKMVTLVASNEDAQAVKSILTPTLPSGTEVVISERPEVVVETVLDFETRFNAEVAAADTRKAAIAKLSDDERKALGL